MFLMSSISSSSSLLPPARFFMLIFYRFHTRFSIASCRVHMQPFAMHGFPTSARVRSPLFSHKKRQSAFSCSLSFFPNVGGTRCAEAFRPLIAAAPWNTKDNCALWHPRLKGFRGSDSDRSTKQGGCQRLYYLRLYRTNLYNRKHSLQRHNCHNTRASEATKNTFPLSSQHAG